MKICLPLRESSQTKIIEIFQIHKNDCDLFEVWLDAVEDLDIPALVESCPKPLLCVCKAKEEKGDFQGTEEERIDLLIQAAQAGAEFIDIGIHTAPALIEKAQKEMADSKLILSFHNWDKTPKMTSMLPRIEEMLKLNPDYVKYVATAESVEDNIKVFRLAENLKKKEIKFLVMCMGETGKISRVITPLLGSEWMYAPVTEAAASAPGQLSANSLKDIWNKISNKKL